MPQIRPKLSVVAAVIEQNERYFIQQRPPGKPMAGLWEFAGGKIEAGESAWAALVRELNEELGIIATRGEPLIQLNHMYPDQVIDLDVWRVVEWMGEPLAQEQQSTGWFSIDELSRMPLLPADGPVLNVISLPHRLLVTPPCGVDREAFLRQLELTVAEHQHTLCILQQQSMSEEDYRELATYAYQVLNKLNCTMILYGVSDRRVKLAQELGIERIHVPASMLTNVSLYKKFKWSVSCHTLDELDLASTLGADFALLGSVTNIASSIDGGAMEWATFREFVKASNLPVYVIGSMQCNDETRSRLEGAQGVAEVCDWSSPGH